MAAVLATACMAPRAQAVSVGLGQEVIFPTVLGEKAVPMSPRVKKTPGHCHSRGLCQPGLSSDHNGHSTVVPDNENHLLSLYLRRETQLSKA